MEEDPAEYHHAKNLAATTAADGLAAGAFAKDSDEDIPANPALEDNEEDH